MDVVCEKCQVTYEFDESQIQGAGVRVKCTACGHLFRVEKPAAPEEEPIVLDKRKGDSPWMVRRTDGSVYHFQDLATLQKWIIERKVGREDEISRSGEAWRRLGAIGELASFFQLLDKAEKVEKTNSSAVISLTGGVEPVRSTMEFGVEGDLPEIPEEEPHYSGASSPAAKEPPPATPPDNNTPLEASPAPSEEASPEKGGSSNWFQEPNLSEEEQVTGEPTEFDASLRDFSDYSFDDESPQGFDNDLGDEFDFPTQRKRPLRVLLFLLLALIGVGVVLALVKPSFYQQLSVSFGFSEALPQAQKKVDAARTLLWQDVPASYKKAIALFDQARKIQNSSYPGAWASQAMVHLAWHGHLLLEKELQEKRIASIKKEMRARRKRIASLHKQPGTPPGGKIRLLQEQVRALSAQLDAMDDKKQATEGKQREQWKKAKHALQTAQKQKADHPYTLLARVDLHHKESSEKGYEIFRRLLQQARKKLSNNKAALDYLKFFEGYALANNNKTDKGIALLVEVATSRPDFLRARFWLARSLARQNKREAAIKELRRILQKAPQYEWAMNYLTFLSLPEKSPSRPAPVARRDPERPVPPEGRKAPAAQRPVQRRPAPRKKLSFRGIIRRAWYLRRAEKYRSALRYYKRALARKRNSSLAFSGIGWCYLELKKFKAAKKAFDRALSLNKNNADAYFGLGLYYRREGLKQSARRVFRNYLKKFPKGRDAGEVRLILKSL